MIDRSSSPHGGPYRTHDGAASARDDSTIIADADSDIATTLLFVWGTAALRFLIVCRRHEAYTADPIFAALLTFGMPAIAFVRALRAALRSVTALFASRSVES